MNQIEMEHLKRVTDICANRGELIEQQAASLDRANLRIIAKDMQIAELTRMLFALGKQDGQTLRMQAAEIARLTEKVRYAYVQIKALERVK